MSPVVRGGSATRSLHTQRAHAQYLHERGAGFVFTAKQNQLRLYAALDSLSWAQVPIAVRDVDTAHGRITTRTIQVPASWPRYATSPSEPA